MVFHNTAFLSGMESNTLRAERSRRHSLYRWTSELATKMSASSPRRVARRAARTRGGCPGSESGGGEQEDDNKFNNRVFDNKFNINYNAVID
jgi:hypothetical protein